MNHTSIPLGLCSLQASMAVALAERVDASRIAAIDREIARLEGFINA